MVVAVARRNNMVLEHAVEGRRFGDPLALIANARKARGVLGRSRQRSDIDNFMRNAWNWHERDVQPRSEAV